MPGHSRLKDGVASLAYVRGHDSIFGYHVVLNPALTLRSYAPVGVSFTPPFPVRRRCSLAKS